MIAVALRLVAAPAKRDELLAAVRTGLLGPTRSETGCIRYRFYQDVENENAFSFVEEWESWDALRTLRSGLDGVRSGSPSVNSSPMIA